MIKFYPPDAEARRKIWRVMSEQFGLAEVATDTSLIDVLVEAFPTATGRDIKGLTKLVAKYCRHKQVAPTFEAFKCCSVFRGMDLGQAA
jgi:hypothetical protein